MLTFKLTNAANRLMTKAAEVALVDGQPCFIATPHIFLGIVDEGVIARQLRKKFGVTYEDVAEIVDTLEFEPTDFTSIEMRLESHALVVMQKALSDSFKYREVRTDPKRILVSMLLLLDDDAELQEVFEKLNAKGIQLDKSKLLNLFVPERTAENTR